MNSRTRRRIALIVLPLVLLSWDESRAAEQFTDAHWMWLLFWAVSMVIFVRMCISDGDA